MLLLLPRCCSRKPCKFLLILTLFLFLCAIMIKFYIFPYCHAAGICGVRWKGTPEERGLSRSVIGWLVTWFPLDIAANAGFLIGGNWLIG